MSIFVTILFFLLWSVIPTAVEGITNAAKITGILLAIPALWMLVIWVDRMLTSRREGRPA
jgi:membrane associated rhomboid family serine protease